MAAKAQSSGSSRDGWCCYWWCCWRLDVFAILFLLLPFQVCVTKFLGAQSHSHRDPDKKHVPDSYSGSIIVSFPLAMMNISWQQQFKVERVYPSLLEHKSTVCHGREAKAEVPGCSHHTQAKEAEHKQEGGLAMKSSKSYPRDSVLPARLCLQKLSWPPNSTSCWGSHGQTCEPMRDTSSKTWCLLWHRREDQNNDSRQERGPYLGVSRFPGLFQRGSSLEMTKWSKDNAQVIYLLSCF